MASENIKGNRRGVIDSRRTRTQKDDGHKEMLRQLLESPFDELVSQNRLPDWLKREGIAPDFSGGDKVVDVPEHRVDGISSILTKSTSRSDRPYVPTKNSKDGDIGRSGKTAFMDGDNSIYITSENIPRFTNPFRELGHRLKIASDTNVVSPTIADNPATDNRYSPSVTRFDSIKSLAEHKRQQAYSNNSSITNRKRELSNSIHPRYSSTLKGGGDVDAFESKEHYVSNMHSENNDDSAHIETTSLSPENGQNVLDMGSKYLGTPYDKLDCSHFVNQAYKDAGYEYPYTTSNGDWESVGFVEVEEPQVGDVIQWRGHVGIVSEPENHKFLGAHSKGVNYQDWTISAFTKKGPHKFYRFDPEKYKEIMKKKKQKGRK